MGLSNDEHLELGVSDETREQFISSFLMVASLSIPGYEKYDRRFRWIFARFRKLLPFGNQKGKIGVKITSNKAQMTCTEAPDGLNFLSGNYYYSVEFEKTEDGGLSVKINNGRYEKKDNLFKARYAYVVFDNENVVLISQSYQDDIRVFGPEIPIIGAGIAQVVDEYFNPKLSGMAADFLVSRRKTKPKCELFTRDRENRGICTLIKQESIRDVPKTTMERYLPDRGFPSDNCVGKQPIAVYNCLTNSWDYDETRGIPVENFEDFAREYYDGLARAVGMNIRDQLEYADGLYISLYRKYKNVNPDKRKEGK